MTDFTATGQLLGTVVAVQANFYRVQLDQQQGEMREMGINILIFLIPLSSSVLAEPG